MNAFPKINKAQVRNRLQNKGVGEIIPTKAQRKHSHIGLQGLFREFIQTIGANDGIEQQGRWVSSGVENARSGRYVAGAGVHGDHFGGEERSGADTAEEHVRVELFPLLEEAFACECPENGGVGGWLDWDSGRSDQK